MKWKQKKGFILPLAIVVVSAVAFALLVWLSVNHTNKENIVPQNTNVVSDLKTNYNTNKNTDLNDNQPGGECVASGCSGQVCAAEGNDIITTCEIQDWFSCLSLTKCERQVSGQCDWTENPIYLNCLKEKNKTN